MILSCNTNHIWRQTLVEIKIFNPHFQPATYSFQEHCCWLRRVCYKDLCGTFWKRCAVREFSLFACAYHEKCRFSLSAIFAFLFHTPSKTRFMLSTECNSKWFAIAAVLIEVRPEMCLASWLTCPSSFVKIVIFWPERTAKTRRITYSQIASTLCTPNIVNKAFRCFAGSSSAFVSCIETVAVSLRSPTLHEGFFCI